MNLSSNTNPVELQLQKELLNCALGERGSGYDRYAAAMYFNRRGELSDQLLEIYRRCCKHDNEDPIKLAELEGVVVEIGESNLKSNTSGLL